MQPHQVYNKIKNQIIMNTEVKVNQQTAETIYISHPEASYGIFCFNSVGDLFLNSDWGFYGFAWRAYGNDFKEFLSGLEPEYTVNKFEINFSLSSNFWQ